MDLNDLRESGDEEQDDEDERDDLDNQEETDENLDVTVEKGQESNGKENRQESQIDESHQSSNKTNSTLISKSESSKNHAHPLNHPRSKHNWKSANAFINFVQDFKKENSDTIVIRNLFQTCGERWKNMTDEQKQPYITAANTVKRLRQRKNGESSSNQQIKKSVTRVSKRKADTKRKETYKKRTKVYKRDVLSNSDTDTATTTVFSSISDADSF